MYRQTITTVKHNKTYCTLIATMILAAYSVNLVKEIDDTEPYVDYYNNILPLKMKCDYEILRTWDRNGTVETLLQRGFLKYWSNCFSYQVIGNDRIIPIISSVVIVYLTYVLANSITNNRIIGLISMGTMSINPLLTKFDSSPTYDQLWVALFMISIVLLYKKPLIGLITYPFSIFAKILAAGYIPGLILHIIIEKKIKNRKKILVSLGILSAFGLVGLVIFGVGSAIEIHPERLLDGFLRIFESVWAVFPVIMGVIILDRFFMPKDIPNGKKIILVWITWILLTTPLIYLFTPEQLQFGYRFVPFAVFFSMYIGIVAVQLGNFVTERRLRHTSFKRVLT